MCVKVNVFSTLMYPLLKEGQSRYHGYVNIPYRGRMIVPVASLTQKIELPNYYY